MRNLSSLTSPKPGFARTFENIEVEDFGHFGQRLLDCVIPAWSAGIQGYTDVFGSILANLDTGYPCRHDEVCIFIAYGRAEIQATLRGGVAIAHKAKLRDVGVGCSSK